MQTPYTKKYGFTIVELLTVIVVIAILAIISITAYTNFQQRAKNTAIINAASQSLKMIQAYIVEHGTYPRVVINYANDCVTNISGCQNGAGNSVSQTASFSGEIEKIGTLPQTVPTSGDSHNGIIYQYTANRTIDGVSQPAVLIYWLQGTSQSCGISGVVASQSAIDTTLSTTGYTAASQSGKTRCDVIVPGPAHS